VALGSAHLRDAAHVSKARLAPQAATAASVAVVVLNWNGRDDTLACLRSLALLRGARPSVIVVDNGSADGSVTSIRQQHPEVELIETGRNLGFAGGNNVGIRRALESGADYVLLLNNDTEVDPGLIDAFVAAARQRPDAGVFSAKIYFHADPQRIWYAGAAWNSEAARFDQVGEGELDDGRPAFSRLAETAYACGCAFFVSAARLREIGLLDEKFFLYFEETDWCFRARAAGHPSVFVPEARLWHKVSVSFGGEGSPLALYFLTRNRLLWARKHGNPAQRSAVRRATWRGLVQRLVAPLVGRQVAPPRTPRTWWWGVRQALADPHNRAFFLGVRDFWRGRYGNCPPVVRELAASARQRALLRPPAAIPRDNRPSAG
jgi:GT2 family glycosyltransferase